MALLEREVESTSVAMTLTCLGTSDAFGSGGRHCAGYIVDVDGSQLLLDAGPSLLSALKSQGRTTENLDAIVISHLHGDHFGGIPFLLLEYTYESPRTRPLVIVGPPGTERRVFEAYYALYAEARGKTLPFALRFVEVADGDCYEVGGARIESFRVPHQENLISLGHRVRGGGRTLVYSGDTEWTPNLLNESRDADLFLCECSTFATAIPKHIRYVEIEENRDRFECHRLLLTHLGREVRERSSEVAEQLANDGLTIQLG